jgi:hypothetical protein
MIRQYRCDRAIAYDYMKPLERAASFVKSSIYFCDKNLAGLASEIKMWQEPDVIAALGADECEYQRQAAATAIAEFNAEKRGWEKMFSKLSACNVCNGSGRYWVNDSQDESHEEKCQGCGGTGFVTTPQEAPQAVVAVAKVTKPSLLETIGRKFR